MLGKTLKKFLSPAEVDERTAQRFQGVGAETVLRTIGPAIEQRMEALLNRLDAAPAELGALLDIRAQIGEVRRIQSSLRALRDAGKEASEALEEIFQSQ